MLANCTYHLLKLHAAQNMEKCVKMKLSFLSYEVLQEGNYILKQLGPNT